TPLAFEFSKTRTICDAFDAAWAFLQGLGSDLTQAPKSLATQTILAKRIIEMADQGLRDIPALRDDALAFLQRQLALAAARPFDGTIQLSLCLGFPRRPLSAGANCRNRPKATDAAHAFDRRPLFFKHLTAARLAEL